MEEGLSLNLPAQSNLPYHNRVSLNLEGHQMNPKFLNRGATYPNHNAYSTAYFDKPYGLK